MGAIHWNLTAEEAQSIVNIMAARPYIEVAGLISKLMQQSQEAPTPPKLGLVEGGGEQGGAQG
jgi:hypothetical protein